MRYFIHLAYHGAHFSGWQKQINTSNTIQEVIENALLKIFKKEIVVFGCGRTDAGVHASQYIMHIDLDEAPNFDLKFRLNKNLPDTIAVYDIIAVEDHQHSRYDATWRTYDYFIHTRKDSELHRVSAYYDHAVFDVKKMQEAAQLLLDVEDFRPLCKHPDVYKNTNCNVVDSRIYHDTNTGRIRYCITANRFLRGMVRYTVHSLLEIGAGRLSIKEFALFLKQDLLIDNKPALPNGLFLSAVQYPYLSFENKHPLLDMLKVGLDNR